MRFYVTDDRGIVQDDQLTEGRARRVGQRLVEAGTSPYAAVFRHGPASDPDRYSRKPAFYVRPAEAASPG